MAPPTHTHHSPIPLVRLRISPIEAIATTAAIGLLLVLNEVASAYVHEPLFIAPLAASLVILFLIPGMTWLRTWGVLGGQVLCAAVALIIMAIMSDHLIAAGMVTTLVALVVMHATGCMHPPGLATALLIVLAPSDRGPTFLVFPVLVGSGIVVAVAWAVYLIERHIPARWGGRLAQPNTATSAPTSS